MKRIFYYVSMICIAVMNVCCGKAPDTSTGGNNPMPSIYVFSNNYHSLSQSSKPALAIERSTIYEPGDNDYHFSHHPSIAYFKGKFYAIFSNGINGEDEGKQRVLIATSPDSKEWTWKVLQDTSMDYVLTPGGLFVANENLMVAYFTRNDYDYGAYENGRGESILFARATDDGENWSEPVNLGIAAFPCHCPTRLSSKRLIFSQNKQVYYTDDPTGLSGWTLAKSAGFTFSNNRPTLCEGSIIETNDSIYVLYRDTKYGTLLWQESAAATGDYWTSPRKTKFTDNNTKSHFGKLPNGNTYYVGVPDTLNMGGRTPLMLSISEDGYNFNKHYTIAKDYYDIKYSDGRWKTGQFGYPYSIIQGDTLYVIVSRRKEMIEVIRVPINKIK